MMDVDMQTGAKRLVAIKLRVAGADLLHLASLMENIGYGESKRKAGIWKRHAQELRGAANLITAWTQGIHDEVGP
jgi:hypothetical protein